MAEKAIQPFQVAGNGKETAAARSDYYVYILFRHDTGIPFYVGKGRGKRIYQHKWRSQQLRNPHKWNILTRAYEAGSDIPAVKIATGLEEDAALAIEEAFIKAIGREPIGPLVNLTNGGQRSTGYVASAETRAKLGRPGRKQTPEWIAKRIAVANGSRKGKKRKYQFTETHRAKIGAANKKRAVSEKTREKMKAVAKKRLAITERNALGQFKRLICSEQSSS